ncbi:MAG: SUMF1/EgtB/PvdO family nonheme iron enzyme [Cyclobacteriaceae bacterium]
MNRGNVLCSLLPLQNNGHQFYYALTLSKDNLSSLKENLYVVGLASLHSLHNVDNVALIKKNFEKQFLLDYLKVDFNGESSDATGKVFSANYLLPMILLYEDYLKENKTTEAKALRELMEQVARTSGKEEIISTYLGTKPLDVIPYFPSTFDAKAFDEKMRAISENKFYAQYTEVSNEEYNFFLSYLSSHALTDLYEKYKFDLSAYTEPALSYMKGYSMSIAPTKKNKFFTQYPAVNMTYEAANAYCEWLTDQYNHSPEHKFKKVKFRLPTISEWQIGALGFKGFTSWNLDENIMTVGVPPDSVAELNMKGKSTKLSAKNVSYPWWGAFNYRNKPQNRRNCFLGNFRVPDDCKQCQIPKLSGDGWTMMAPTACYFPNNIGLFDVVGNVAEMTNEKGKACGGSWNHFPQQSTIRSINTYDNPQSDIGFRVFMEVIEK